MRSLFKKGIIAVASSLILWACQSRESELVVAHATADTPEFYATMEQPADPSTRVYADEDLMVLWSARDRISIFNRYTYNQPYRFDGETGDNAGSFSCIDDGSFVTSENCLRTVRQDAKILIYFGVDRSGSAVLDWYEYTPAIDWGD